MFYTSNTVNNKISKVYNDPKEDIERAKEGYILSKVNNKRLKTYNDPKEYLSKAKQLGKRYDNDPKDYIFKGITTSTVNLKAYSGGSITDYNNKK